MWEPRSLEDEKAARPLSRCSRDGKIVLDDIFGGSPEVVATVTRGCLALLVRQGTASIVPLPATDPVLVLEGVDGQDEMFARMGSMVVDMKYERGAATATLANGTTVQASLNKGDVMTRGGVQLFGPRARDLVTCRIGPRLLPLELCDERFFEADLVERFFRDAADRRRAP